MCDSLSSMRKKSSLRVQHVNAVKTNLTGENIFSKVLITKGAKGRGLEENKFYDGSNILANIWLSAITTQVHVACSTQQLWSQSIG